MDEEEERKSQLGFSFIVRMNNLVLFYLVVEKERKRGGTCRGGVLITEERSRLGASPGVEQQQGPALLAGPVQPKRPERQSQAQDSKLAYISL